MAVPGQAHSYSARVPTYLIDFATICCDCCCQKLEWPKCSLDETNDEARKMTDVLDKREVGWFMVS